MVLFFLTKSTKGPVDSKTQFMNLMCTMISSQIYRNVILSIVASQEAGPAWIRVVQSNHHTRGPRQRTSVRFGCTLVESDIQTRPPRYTSIGTLHFN